MQISGKVISTMKNQDAKTTPAKIIYLKLMKNIFMSIRKRWVIIN